MDFVAIANDVGKVVPSSQSLVALALISFITAILFFSHSGRRLREQLNETVFANWRLALLGATGLVLSVASGWTTWDGMRNFTQEPILSLMITFGIQGVMLIVAWLIGESFATGMNFRPSAAKDGNRSSRLPSWEPIAGTIIGIMFFAATALLIVNQTAGTDQLSTASGASSGSSFLLPSGLLIAAIVLLLGLTIVLNAGSDIVGNYLQALRVMVRSAVLWVMFLACMATSVFFSFDSLFSTIFPKEERVRAAELRAQNQVAGVITDIGGLAGRRRLEERDRLFDAEGWQRFDAELEKLVVAARQAPKALQDFFEEKMRERQRLVAQRQEEKAAAQGQQVRVKQRNKILNDEIGRARGATTQLLPVVEDLKTKVFAKDQEIVAKNAEAEAEAGGIGITSRSGRGPKYREIAAQLRILREQKKNLQLQLSAYEKRLAVAREQISRGETELSTAQGELAKLQGRAQTADQLIKLAEQTKAADDEPAFDPTAGLRQLERARISFRQEPTQKRLAKIQGLCGTLVGAMAEVPTLKAQAAQIDCDPGEANEAAGRVFALNTGITVLAARCVGGDKLPKTGGADGLFLFARQCVQDAGLPSKDTDAVRTRINYLELNRDDKAHRFVVTTNAFGDGNKLAYLALAIAIAIDSLVFMSGLFGANAVRSPLSDVPSHKGRTAKQLEAIIDTALQPHAYDTARMVLGAMRPITPQGGFTAEITVDDADPHAPDFRRVLNAGSSIGAVRHGDEADRVYQVRAEFFEYLSIAAQREYEKDKNRVHVAELERTVSVALLPNVGANAELVLDFMHPIQEDHGFMAEIMLADIADSGHLKIVRSALNAGAVYERVQRVRGSTAHYFIHADFYKTLTSLRGRLLMSSAPIQGGRIAESAPATAQPVLDTDQATRQLADQRPAPANIAAEVRGQLLEAIGVDSQLYQKSREALGFAVNAHNTIERLIIDADQIISRELNAEMNDAGDRLSSAGNLLVSKYSGISGAQGEIDAARQEIEQMLPIFMMYPGGRYYVILETTIAQMERAAQSDTGLAIGEQELLDRLRDHATAFVSARDIEGTLASVGDYLTTPAMPNVLRFGDRTNSA